MEFVEHGVILTEEAFVEKRIAGRPSALEDLFDFRKWLLNCRCLESGNDENGKGLTACPACLKVTNFFL